MTSVAALALYSSTIAGAALVSAAIPVVFPVLRDKTTLLLSFSAGVMLGAAFFHMLPEAVETGGLQSLPWMLFGFVFLYLLERYVLIHLCKEDEGCEVHEGHHHGQGTMGMAALFGLSVHTLADGFALGAAVDGGVGGSVFLAILFHKVPNSFSLASILIHERTATKRMITYVGLFAATLPLGALLYHLLYDLTNHEAFGAVALAFSAGTFLHLAVSDLIPDLHRHRDHRLSLSLALLAGIALMLLLDAVAPAH